LILANDDVVLNPDTLSLMREDAGILESRGVKYGFLGARSDYVLPDQNIRFPVDGDRRAGLKWESEHQIKLTPVIAPIWASISREAWGVAKFPSTNWYSDNIICHDLNVAGYQHFVSRAYVQKTPQEIAQENLAKGTTIKPIPENVFQKMAGGARTAGEFVNRAGTAADVAKLFPGYTGQSTVNIPTSFNFAPKQAPTGEIIPGGLQTQPVQVNQLLQAIKPADVLGISGAERAYTDVGLGKAPQPLDVLDVAGLGAIGYGAGKTTLKATKGVPVGLSIQETKGLLETAPKSDIGFYSAVEQAALATPRKSGTGQSFLNDISKGQDVRADEIKWMGLDDFLKGKQNVTRQEVQDYIANNRVDVQEVKSTIPRLPGEEMPGDEGAFLPKFGQYTLPGGENYRE